MNLWSADKIMNRLNVMLDHAIAGDEIEAVYDETKMSALETKMAKYQQLCNYMKCTWQFLYYFLYFCICLDFLF